MRARLVSLVVRPTAPRLCVGLAIAALLIIAETLVLYPLKAVASESTLGVVYLLGVVVVAILWGFRLAAVTSVASVLAFDFFHIPPFFSLSPTASGDWIAVTVYMVVALAASTLSELARLRAAEADQRRREAEASRDKLRVLADQQAALRRIATLVARAVEPAEVFSAVAEELARCLAVAAATLVRYQADGGSILLASHDERGPTKAMPVGGQFAYDGENIAATVYRTGSIARMDSHEYAAGSAAAYIRTLGLRSGVGVPIIVDGRLFGAAIIGSTRCEPLPPDTEARVSDFTELVATAIANAETRSQLTASRARIIAAADGARRRFERDLHDGAQQRLVSVGLELRMAEASVPPELHALREQISRMVTSLTGVSHDLRELSRGIHPAILSRGGLGPALNTLARRSTVPVEVHLGIDGRRLPDAVEVAAYYVVAEALTNTAKHAQASEVNVSAAADDANLHLLIRDDGIGGADLTKGSGLIGLTDRIEALGGKVQISSIAGSGTSLVVTIPFEIE
jgi:signal transduction histidine kinase